MTLPEEDRIPRAESAFSPLALVSAFGAAVVGAAIWAGIAYFTDYEIGWIAWIVGGLVGLGTTAAGGRGVAMAGAAALLALVGIFGGKLTGMHFATQKGIAQQADTNLTRAAYERLVTNARDWHALGADVPDAALATFMVDHAWTNASSAEQVAGEELSFFRAETGPGLLAFHAASPSYDDWRADEMERARVGLGDLLDDAVEGLNSIDLVFAFLGLATAWSMVMKASV